MANRYGYAPDDPRSSTVGGKVWGPISHTASDTLGKGFLGGFGTSWTATFGWINDGTGGGDKSVPTGINPSDIASALYGKPIPLSVLSEDGARFGTAGFILGPWVSDGKASFGVSFGFPADPAGTRAVYQISLNGKVVWEYAPGSGAGPIASAGFLSEPFTCRFVAGTMSQAADPLEIEHYGAEAIAYRPQKLLIFEDLNLAPFDNLVPFVSCIIKDITNGELTVGVALEKIAYSPWLEYTASDFEEDGVDDLIQGMILTEDVSFLGLLQNCNSFYRNMDILQTDKLRVVDRGSSTTADQTLTRSHIVCDDGVRYNRREESSVPRELEVLTIDPDQDFMFVPYKASRPRHPVPVTTSVGKQTMTLPIILDATSRASMTTYAKYHEDNARKTVRFRAMLAGLELEPGDLINLSGLADGFDQVESFKIVETSHDADYTVEITAEAVLKCMIPADPHFGEVVLLLHFNESPDGATTFDDFSQYGRILAAIDGGVGDHAEAKFGDGSLKNGGATTGSFGLTSELDISPTNTSPYVIELWVRFTLVGSATDPQVLISRNTGAFGLVWQLFNPIGSDELTFWTSSDSINITATMTTSGANLVINTWYHIAVDKDSTGKVRVYVDGVMRAGSTPANSVIVAAAGTPITIGLTGLNFDNLAGWIDDVRITKGISRYGDVYGDSSFPVPTFQFSDSV